MAIKHHSPSNIWENNAIYSFINCEVTNVRAEFNYPDKRTHKQEIGYQITIKEVQEIDGDDEDVYMDVAFFRKAMADVKKLRLVEGDLITVKGVMKKKVNPQGGFYHSLVVEKPKRVNKPKVI